MTDEEIDNLRKAINAVAELHHVKNIAFCATAEGDNKFVGFVGEQGLQNSFNAVLNVGRLWQHSRQCIKDILGDFEK